MSDDVYTQTREILIGKQGESGHGGIIENLNILGIECDLDSVYLYKAPRNPSPLIRALDLDLARTQEIAWDNPTRFYSSLLGQFFNPERRDPKQEATPFCDKSYMPGKMPKATKKLVENLNNHNLVLLEGPPGTGKTFTILNLLIHCINNDKRLLIVSDQKAAIHALTEKLQEYLIGQDTTSPESKRSMNLLKGALKVVDETPEPTDTLTQWAGKLSKLLEMDQTREYDGAPDLKTVLAAIDDLDNKMKDHEQKLQSVLSSLWPESHSSQTSPKHFHPTTIEDINNLYRLY